MKHIATTIPLILIFLLLVILLAACSPNEGDTVEKYYTDDDDAVEGDDDSDVDDDDVADDDDNDTADDDDSVPTEIPEEPTELRAIESGSSTINLSWTDNSDDEDGFWVYRQESGAKGFTAIAQTGPDVPFYFDDSAACETEYDYYVTAYNMAGESAGSNEAAATAGYCEVASPSDLGAVTISQTQVDLAWSDNSFNETNFQIQRKESGSDVWVNIGDAEANVTEYSDLVAVCDTDYQYRVRAYNQHSDSAWCSPAGTTTMDCPIVRPQPVLISSSPASHLAFSQDEYFLTIEGEGIASDSMVLLGDFQLACDTEGIGGSCQADDSGVPVPDTCADQCIATISSSIMRNGASYVVRLMTPSPVYNGKTVSDEHSFFSVISPQPNILRVWPKGVVQYYDEENLPIEQTIEIRAWATNLMDNANIRLESNSGALDRIEFDPYTGDQIGVFHVSTQLIYPSDEPAVLAIENPSPGGGSYAIDFGINPVQHLVDDNLVSDIRATRASWNGPFCVDRMQTPVVRTLYNAIPTSFDEGYYSIRNEKGDLLYRMLSDFSPGLIPLLTDAYWIDFQGNLGHYKPYLVRQEESGVFRGSGDFEAPNFQAMGSFPYSVEIVDLNNDGFLDVVTVNYTGDDVSVRLGEGGGYFSAKSDYDVGENPFDLIVVDVDSDGITDILTSNSVSEDVSILYGNGQGGFGSRVDLPVSSYSHQIKVTDINNDGVSDIVESGGKLEIIYGRGGRLFENTSIHWNDNYGGLEVTDIDSNGWIDVISGNHNIIYIFLNSSLGLSPVPIEKYVDDGALFPREIRSADINHDGAVDLLVGSSKNIYLLMGKGDGAFNDAIEIVMGEGGDTINGVEAADINGDGMLDILASNWGGNGVTYRFGLGDGTFEGLHTIDFDFGETGVSRDVKVADIDGNGTPDITAACQGFVYALNQPGQSFENNWLSEIPTTGFYRLADDINDDEVSDIVVGNEDGYTQSLLGNGDGTFQSPLVADYKCSVLGDIDYVDQDEKKDLVCENIDGDVLIGFGNSSGSFINEEITSQFGSVSKVQLADVDQDHKNDLIMSGSEEVKVSLGNGDGTFNSEYDTYAAVGSSCKDLIVVDLNGDDYVDIVRLSYPPQGPNITVLVNDQSGEFSNSSNYNAGGYNLMGMDVGDVNSDQIPDIVTANWQSSGVSILLGNGDGTFQDYYEIEFGTTTDWPTDIHIVDINGDNINDIVTNTVPDGQITYRLGNLEGELGSIHAFQISDYYTYSFVSGQFDGDDWTDVAIKYDEEKVMVLAPSHMEGTWSQELTDSFSDDPNQPWLQKYATAGANTEIQIHQGKQTVTKVGARVLLEWSEQPTGSVTLTLHSPNEENDPIELGTFTAFDQWPCHLYEGDDDDECEVQSWRLNKTFRETALGSDPAIPELVDWHGVQPTGYWRLEIDNQTGADAEVKNWTVITDGHF